jgi:8-oxo-dGTP pyrophosphatase MutT (NUDIX family)
VASFRPDLVDVWVFRVTASAGLEILMLRRSAGRVLAGLWQGVSGSLEPRERIVEGALRELAEETGLSAEQLEHFYDLDQVNQFHVAALDAVLSAAVFAARIRPGMEPRLSHEHDQMAWLGVDEAIRRSVWPAYRESIRRIAEHLLDPGQASWFVVPIAPLAVD